LADHRWFDINECDPWKGCSSAPLNRNTIGCRKGSSDVAIRRSVSSMVTIMTSASPVPAHRTQDSVLILGHQLVDSLTHTAGLRVVMTVYQKIGGAVGTFGTKLHHHVLDALVHVYHLPVQKGSTGALYVHLHFIEIVSHLLTHLGYLGEQELNHKNLRHVIAGYLGTHEIQLEQ